ncbi:hypothetical protein P168DRAFT_262612 [Aspergillus campestris IBT 28561]|uniref:Zn(2)-C6 fungal-type domain-containing protein n=1 Tax=Aspergillus campestris (strain IBT 28561) TaxID=1392248 RepID=A0A2I1DEL2_ASPC2|nr:uncharacterized protein P168DRAFT_262612 [Aspergillus campestris IBT 28561]PKY08301.1 hypothetical protein P168DRAFT_262612 [Aspergillus campestris IBT 28561]
MSAPTTRRNRSLASCEPCRERKTRCDHGKPVCASCQRRGLGSRCYYHPSPLTKNRSAQRLTMPTPPRSHLATPSSRKKSAKSCQSHPRRSAAGPPKFHTWPFMSTVSDTLPQTPTPGSHGIKAYEAHLATMKEIVSQLRYLPIIEKCLHQYYSSKHNALVPKPVVLPLLETLRTDLVSSGHILREEGERVDLGNTCEISETVLLSSSTEVVITPSLDLHGFVSLFCGPNLRVETIGLLYTMVARASACFVDRDEDKDDAFFQDMVWYSTLTLRLARDLAPQSTDVIIWLANENAHLRSFLEGDASLGVWRLVGDLTTDLLALGLNREATYSPERTPFFLAECRRRCFVTEYYLEKMFGLVFNLPPRITSRYVDVKLPLDLSDDELFAQTPKELEEAKSRLTEDGWNTDGKFRAATWARLRYILSQFREGIVEYHFQASPTADPAQLRELSFRCRQTWDDLLPHLRYTQDCWESDMLPMDCYMHAKVHLAYLQIHFQIYHLLGEDSSSPLPELLDVSANILETVVQMGKSRRKGAFIFNDLPEILLSCGLPSAAVLSTALKNMTQDPSKVLPPGIKTSAVIRNLSVLASQLESVSSSRERNQAFCLQAAKAITTKLDKILDKFAASKVEAAPDVATSTAVSPMSIPTPSIDSSLAGGAGAIGAINLDDYENFDLMSWAIDFDLGNTASNWAVM